MMSKLNLHIRNRSIECPTGHDCAVIRENIQERRYDMRFRIFIKSLTPGKHWRFWVVMSKLTGAERKYKIRRVE